MTDANMSMEKRAEPRLSIKIPVKYHLVEDKVEIKDIAEWRNSEKNAYTLDMSLGGMYIAVDHPLKLRQIIKFDVFLLDKKKILGVYAEVVRVDAERAGLHFLMMKNDDRDFLQSFLDKTILV